MTRSYTDIPLFKGVTPEEWSDYKWQLRNRLTTTADWQHQFETHTLLIRLTGAQPCVSPNNISTSACSLHR